MQSGTIISGGAHATLIGFVLLSGVDFWPGEVAELKVTEVTVISAELFDTMTASDTPLVPMTDMADQEAPDIDFTRPVAPIADDAPTETEMDETEAPTEADDDPDLSAFLDVAQPDVSNVLDAVVAPAFDDFAPSIFQPAQEGNELNAPMSSMIAPPPRNAPRIDTNAFVRPAEDALPSIDNTEAVTDGPGDPVEADPQNATAAQESTTEITPEGQEDVEISNYAPETAARPARRPANLRIPVEEPPEDTSTEDDAILAAIQQAELEAAEAATSQPQNAEMSDQETASIVSAFSPYWNKANIIGSPDFEQYVVIIEFNVTSEGVVERPIVPYEPSNPQGLFDVAYQSARRAVLQAGTIPLDSAKFPDGLRIRLRFDPASGEIGFN